MTVALVTGGGGFLGQYIVEKLCDQGTKVRVLSRNHYQQLEDLGCECKRGDLRDQNAMIDACQGVDTVFHVAALAGLWGKRKDFFSINVDGTRNVINACQKNNVSKLVYTSSPSVVFGMESLEGVNEELGYPNRYFAYYPESKAVAEKLILQANEPHGLATCALRPHLIWGPRDTHILPLLLQRARTGKLLQIGDGKNLVDLTYVENGADAHILAADKLSQTSSLAGQAYFISDGAPVNLWNWIGEFLKRMGMPPVKKHISYKKAYAIGSFLEVVHTSLPFLGEPRLTRFSASQFATSHYFEISKAKKDFGYCPKFENEEGLQKTIDWFLKNF